MFFEEDSIYHIYNRSNERVFLNRDNYLFFLRKTGNHISPFADILCYCLMPNHFHFMLMPNKKGVEYMGLKNTNDMQYLTRGIGTLLSSYTQALNKLISRRGSLFSHKTKSKLIDKNSEYLFNCFMYIHQNPMIDGLVNKIEDWSYSSFPDYIGIRSGVLVNKNIIPEVLRIDLKQIYDLTYQSIKNENDLEI